MVKKAENIIVGISVGDLNGIGSEVILKTFEDKRMLEFCTPVLFGSKKIISLHKKILNIETTVQEIHSIDQIIHGKINILTIWKEDVAIEIGSATKTGGLYAYKSLNQATQSLKNEKIDVLITAPINKETIQSDEFNFSGHTEFLEHNLEGESLMILMNDFLRIGLITGHIPISKITETITPELIESKVKILNQSLKKDFNINKPKIAVLGLNPHSGDNGVIGKEENDLIISTTPAGATDGLSFISTKADFFEVIYHPWPTELAKRYQNLGKTVIGGLSLLVEQALFQINYFTQKEFDFDQMRQELLKVGYAAIKK